MAQKVNAVLFRRSLNYEWDYKSINLTKEEYSSILYKNLEIKKYFHNLFEIYGFSILTLKLELFKSELIIHISFLKNFQGIEKNKKKKLIKIINKSIITVLNDYYNKKVNVTIKLQDLNKSLEDNLIKFKSNRFEYNKLLKKLKNVRNYPHYSHLIKLVFIIITNKKSAKLLAETMSYLIGSQKRRHNNIFMFFKKTLNVLINSKLSLISGIKILISGRINGFPRAKSRLLSLGTLPLQSLKHYVDYSESKAYTPNGTFGVKVWICQK